MSRNYLDTVLLGRRRASSSPAPYVGIYSDPGRLAQEDVSFGMNARVQAPQGIEAFLKDKFAEVAQKTQGQKPLSTATVAIVSEDNQLTVAHLGDSPLYLFARDESGRMTPHLLIAPHNLTNAEERARLGSSGLPRPGYTKGFGGLGIPGLSSEPEISRIDLSKYFKANDKIFLSASSDGLHEDGIKSEDYAAIIADAEAQGKLQEVPKRMVAHANAKRRGADNLSVAFAELPKERQSKVVLAVFDGHHGRAVADTAAEYIKQSISIESASRIRPKVGPRPPWVRKTDLVER